MKLSSTLLAALLAGSTTLFAQEKQLVKLWETDSVLKTPESVLYDPTGKLLYISNIDGDPGKKDGAGSIGKMSPDGKELVVEWVKGLNGPTGMGLQGNTLWVADVDGVVAIDTKKASIESRIPIAGAGFLNDVSVGPNGDVYVTDSKNGNIHLIRDGKASLLLSNITGINGVLANNTGLYYLAKGALYKAGTGGAAATKIADGMEESTDGVEMTPSGDFIVSSWVGVVYYVKADGAKTVLLDGKAQKRSSADIGYDRNAGVVYIPTFFSNTVAAYQLK